MFLILYFVLICFVCYCVMVLFIGIGCFESLTISLFIFIILFAIFLLRSHLNKEDLFYIARIPLFPAYYVYQYPKCFIRELQLRYENDGVTSLPPKRCEVTSGYVKKEIQKLASNLSTRKTYITETHPAMLKCLDQSLTNGPKMSKPLKIREFSFKTKSSFKHLYPQCYECKEDKSQCKYTFLKKRECYLVIIRLE